MSKGKAQDCLNLALTINQTIDYLGKVVYCLHEGQKNKAIRNLDLAASQVKKLIGQIGTAEGEVAAILDHKSSPCISENLESVNQLITEIEEVWDIDEE